MNIQEAYIELHKSVNAFDLQENAKRVKRKLYKCYHPSIDNYVKDMAPVYLDLVSIHNYLQDKEESKNKKLFDVCQETINKLPPLPEKEDRTNPNSRIKSPLILDILRKVYYIKAGKEFRIKDIEGYDSQKFARWSEWAHKLELVDKINHNVYVRKEGGIHPDTYNQK